MAQFRVLVTPPYLVAGDSVHRRLTGEGMEVVFSPWHRGRSEEETIALLEEIDAVVAFLDPFTERVLEGSRRLKVISRAGVGFDTVSVPAATAHGVAVCTTPGANNTAVAEFAFSSILLCSRRVVENLAEVKNGGWVRRQGKDLAGNVLGIVGLGTIGKELAKRAIAFGMRVLAYDVARDDSFATVHGVEYVPLERLLGESDFVSLHLFLDEKTHHLINSERLAMMKPTAYLINTSRGGVVDTEALHEALSRERLAGAALDVFEEEPLGGESPLRTLKNVYLTPHVAGYTVESALSMGLMAAENVIRVLHGERPLHVVNSEVLKSPLSGASLS